jgi:hypothetical protein
MKSAKSRINKKTRDVKTVKAKKFFMVSDHIFSLGLKPRAFVVYCCLLKHSDRKARRFLSKSRAQKTSLRPCAAQAFAKSPRRNARGRTKKAKRTNFVRSASKELMTRLELVTSSLPRMCSTA